MNRIELFQNIPPFIDQNATASCAPTRVARVLAVVCSITAIPSVALDVQEIASGEVINFSLTLVCELYLYATSKDITTAARNLLISHGILDSSDILYGCETLRLNATSRLPFQLGSTPERWQCLVRDQRFSNEIGAHIIKLGIVDRSCGNVFAEYAAAKGALLIMQGLYPFPPISPQLETLEVWHCQQLQNVPPISESLLQCAIMDQGATLSHLLDVIASMPPSLHPDTATFTSAITLAAKQNCLDSLRALLKRSPVSNTSTFHIDPNADNGAAIAWASRVGNTAAVELLLKHGTNLSVQNGMAVLWAAEYGHEDILVQLLASLSPDQICRVIHAQEDYCLRWAAARGHVNIVYRLLHDYRAYVDAREGYALRYAVRFNHLDVVKVLCQEGKANIHLADNDAVRWASAAGYHDILEFFQMHSKMNLKELLQANNEPNNYNVHDFNQREE